MERGLPLGSAALAVAPGALVALTLSLAGHACDTRDRITRLLVGDFGTPTRAHQRIHDLRKKREIPAMARLGAMGQNGKLRSMISCSDARQRTAMCLIA